MRKLLIYILIILVFSCGCATTALKEDKTVKMQAASSTASNKDAYEDFKSASELIIPADITVSYMFAEVLNKGWTKEDKNLEKLLSDNEPAFKEFEKGLVKEQLTFPSVTNPEERRERLFTLNRLTELARLLNLRIQFQLYKKDYAKAVQYCFDIIKFGQHMEKGGNSLSSRMGMAIESNGYKNLRNIFLFQAKGLNYTRLLEKLQVLRGGTDSRTQLEKILKKEFFDIKLNVLPLVLSDFDWMDFTESYRKSGYTDEDIEQSIRVCYMDALQYIGLPYKEGLKKWILEEKPQNPVRQIFLPILKNMYIECGRLDTERDATFIIIGLESYYNKNKQYPGKLFDLVPDYLPSVPNDSFSGEPFIYQRRGKGWLMYSVGSDLRDGFGQIHSYSTPDGSGDIIFYKE
ncbi:MAG: hypothetical protein PHW62_05440 [Candidatus Ratteibacteria bacterium]|nr:hypothetical protein [Candidatus Ratteibacteria bacterium]